ncbi:flagellar basal body P-ring formation chaperone FlgA [Hippea maritima]|uniref:Flagella basal body P-ring formation protein FlgA n=1 Tax=Hippea maritima (strain ATCC 700847 / DSM 10411 / MH2) TaxID=760142 RepID=F2LVB3_HIPMA|nr:flagellar basal body P-ring formation chaperone FlgA [Hippea maritima]AEA33697.1 flagella basal body P-ring formation protein FlgA [Hippea maritima DSM 10411]
MRCYKLLITLSVSLILLLSGYSFGCDVVLRQTAVVSSSTITLKDISSSCPEKYANIQLGASPYINNSITLTKPYIAAILKRNGVNLKLCGSTKIKIYSKAFLLTKNKISNLIKRKDLVFITPLPMKFKLYPYNLRLLSQTKKGNIIIFKIALLKNNKIFKKISITAKCSSKGTLIPVAAKDIESGSIITPDDITFKTSDRVLSTYLTNKPSIINRVAISFIKKGSPFTLSNTKRFRPVKVGDIVKVMVISGNIVIRTTAKALRGGYKDEIIPIMYLSSKRVFPAKIIGKKEVLVQ